MFDSTPHGRKRKPTFWVPESFHPENTLPPRLLPHCQSAYYLMHAIIVRVAFGDRKCARLKNEYLRDVIGRYACENIIDALLATSDIRRASGYFNGKRAYGYLPGEQYLTRKLRHYFPTNPDLLARLERAQAEIEFEQKRFRKPIHDVWEQWQTSLRIDLGAARRIIGRLPPSSNPYDVQTLIVERIRRRHHRFTVDPYGRVHNSITSLHRTLRPTLRVNQKPLASVDIVNSQPALLAMLLHRCQNTHQCCLGAHNDQGDGLSIYHGTLFTPIEGEFRLRYAPSEGFSKYCELAITGRLYEYLMDKTGLSRKDVKTALLRDVFGKRGTYPSVVERAFRGSFPGVWSFIRRFNRDDHGALLKQLQRVESDLVIHRIGERLAQGECGPCVSLHDSVFCRRDDLTGVQTAFQSQFDAMGFALQLKAA